MTRKLTILSYLKTSEVYDGGIACDIGGCKNPAELSLSLLGDDWVNLCQKHLKLWAQEVLKIVDEQVQK